MADHTADSAGVHAPSSTALQPPTLLFDLDGTLTNPYEGITRSLQHALRALGHDSAAEEDLRQCIGPPLRTSFASLLGNSDTALVEKAVALYRERYFATGLFENVMYDGVHEMLDGLSAAGHRMFVVTSKVAAAAQMIVEHFGLEAYFERVYGSDPDGLLDDKGDLVAYVLKAEALCGSECLMIGDRMHDVIAARKNGLRGIGVLWGFGSRDELVAAGAANLCETPSELSTLLTVGSRLEDQFTFDQR